MEVRVLARQVRQPRAGCAKCKQAASAPAPPLLGLDCDRAGDSPGARQQKQPLQSRVAPFSPRAWRSSGAASLGSRARRAMLPQGRAERPALVACVARWRRSPARRPEAMQALTRPAQCARAPCVLCRPRTRSHLRTPHSGHRNPPARRAAAGRHVTTWARPAQRRSPPLTSQPRPLPPRPGRPPPSARRTRRSRP